MKPRLAGAGLQSLGETNPDRINPRLAGAGLQSLGETNPDRINPHLAGAGLQFLAEANPDYARLTLLFFLPDPRYTFSKLLYKGCSAIN